VATIEALYAILSSFEALCGLLSNQFSSTIPIVKLYRCFLVTKSPVFNLSNVKSRRMHDIVGEPEWVHFLNVEQLHVNGCHQNVTEHSTTLGHRISHKSTYVHTTFVSWACLPCFSDCLLCPKSNAKVQIIMCLGSSKLSCDILASTLHVGWWSTAQSIRSLSSL